MKKLGELLKGCFAKCDELVRPRERTLKDPVKASIAETGPGIPRDELQRNYWKNFQNLRVVISRGRFLNVHIWAPLKIPSANRFLVVKNGWRWKSFRSRFPEYFAKSQLQSTCYAPSIWLFFEKMSRRASRNGFLEVPIRKYLMIRPGLVATGLLILLGLGGCVNDLTIQKRRYRQGWHIEKRGTVHPKSDQETALKKENFDLQQEGRREAVLPAPLFHGIWQGEEQVYPTALGLSTSEADGKTSPSAGKAQQLAAPVRGKANSRRMDARIFHGNSLALLFGGTFLLLGAVLAAGHRRARSLAGWARRNKRTSRTVLVLSHLSLGFGAFYGGYYGGLSGWVVDPHIAHGAFGAFLVSLLLYPFRSKVVESSWQFVRRKIHDLTLVSTGVLILFAQGSAISTGSEPNNVVAAHVKEILLPDLSLSTGIPGELAFEDVSTDPEPAPVKKDPPAMPILLTILSLAIFFILLVIVAALSCSLSCNGQQTLAAIVGLGGGAVLLLLLIITIRGIWRTWNQKQKAKLSGEATG